MNTYDGKKITKKHIRSVIRTLDKTAIWKLVHNVYGGKTSSKQVADFMEEFAPTKAIYRQVYEIAYKANRFKAIPSWQTRNEIEFDLGNIKHKVIAQLKENIADVTSPYAKRPMKGYTHLYFCSPIYGHKDYNKWCAMPIDGNERFVELIISVADKYFGPVYDK